MKTFKFSLSTVLTGCALAVLFTTGLAAKEAGLYVHSGVTHWSGLDAPEIDAVADVPGVEPDYEVDGSRVKLSLGVGYNFDEQWGIEGFFVQIPNQVLSGTNWVIPPMGPDGVQTYLSWEVQREQTIFGAAAVYDLYLNEDFSLFAKAGLAIVQHSTNFENVLSLTLDGPENEKIRQSESTDEDSQEFYGAIGLRAPLMETKGSLSFAYQVVQTEDGLEPNLEFGLQWRF